MEGKEAFRDPENFVVKYISTVVDCKLDYRSHRIGEYFYAQRPELTQEEQIPTQLRPKELTANDTFSHRFESLSTFYGPDLDEWIPAILMSCLHVTAIHNVGDLGIGK